jgi:hypothetical protein
MTDDKEFTIKFAPGCFDEFDGTQEELDELMNELNTLVSSGELLENSHPVDFSDMDPEQIEKLELAYEQYGAEEANKKLH